MDSSQAQAAVAVVSRRLEEGARGVEKGEQLQIGWRVKSQYLGHLLGIYTSKLSNRRHFGCDDKGIPSAHKSIAKIDAIDTYSVEQLNTFDVLFIAVL